MPCSSWSNLLQPWLQVCNHFFPWPRVARQLLQPIDDNVDGGNGRPGVVEASGLYGPHASKPLKEMI